MPMTEEDFKTYHAYSIQHYAMEKVKAGTWTVAEAMEKAEEQFAALLPNGIETNNHHLWSINQGRQRGCRRLALALR